MPEPDDDAWPQIVRAASPGRPRLRGRPKEPSVNALWQPGRGALEGSILCCAFGLLFPLLGLVGAGFAIRARRLGSPRWLAAALGAAWCTILGSSVRLALGFGLFP